MIKSKHVVQGVCYGSMDMTVEEVMDTGSGETPEGFKPYYAIFLDDPENMSKKERIKMFVSIASEMLSGCAQFAKNIPDGELCPEYKSLFRALDRQIGYLEGCSSADDFKEMPEYDKHEFTNRSFKG